MTTRFRTLTYARVVAGEEGVRRLRQEVEERGRVEADDGGKPLVVDNVLIDGVHDSAALLVKTLVVPFVVDFSQQVDNSIVLAQKDGVYASKEQILVASVVTGLKTYARFYK